MSRATQINYARTLRDVQEYHHAEADAISKEELLAYLAQRAESVGGSTLNTNVCALKYYYTKVLGKPELIVDLPTPRKPAELGELLNARELRELLDAAANTKHRLVLELLFGLGLRAGEIGKIKLGDFEKAHRTLTVRNAKGGKHRVLPYGDQLRKTLIRYFYEYRPKDLLIRSGTRLSEAGGISVRGVQYILRATLKSSKIDKRVCPHTLRHCFAVHYLNNGGNLVRLSQLLGHAYLSTTFRYLSYASIELRDIDSPLDFLYAS